MKNIKSNINIGKLTLLDLSLAIDLKVTKKINCKVTNSVWDIIYGRINVVLRPFDDEFQNKNMEIDETTI